MNAKEYERQEVLYKIQQRNIKQQIEIKSISIKEYLNQYCAELVLDLNTL